jgi:hypothetical protein
VYRARRLRLKEKREKDRIRIQHKPIGVLKLILDNDSMDVQRIGNISPFGIMIQVKNDVDINTEVGLIYTIENINFEIEGTVKWAKAFREAGTSGKPVGYSQLGIWFSPGNLKENMDFFNILTGPHEH